MAAAASMAFASLGFSCFDAEAAGWTFDDVKAFEVALARHFADQDRWDKLAAAFPDKNRMDLQRKFRELEDDLMRIEESALSSGGSSRTSSTTASDISAPTLPPVIITHAQIQHVNQHATSAPSKKSAKAEALSTGDRRKGVPWTEEEHRLFLLGLAKFGKGDWRSIARNFVTSRTPTQVASHAQKYFIRLNSQNKKDKRRASIHDITSPIDPNNVASLQVSQMSCQSSLGTSMQHSLPSFLPGTTGPSLLPPVAPSLVNLTV